MRPWRASIGGWMICAGGTRWSARLCDLRLELIVELGTDDVVEARAGRVRWLVTAP